MDIIRPMVSQPDHDIKIPGTPSTHLERVELLYEVTRQFASALELDVVLGQVLSLTVQSVAAAVGSIFLLDPTTLQVTQSILARKNLPPEVKRPTLRTVMSKGFAGLVVQKRQADMISNTENDPRWHVFPDDSLAVRSAIAAPLIRNEQVIGVMTLTHPEPDWFSAEQLELLETIASQAASAVEKASLYSRANSDRLMLRAVIAGVQDIILVTDTQNRLILANPAAQKSLAIDESSQGRSIHKVLSEPSLLALYRDAHPNGDVRRDATLQDGRVFDCTLVRIPTVGKVLAMHDVTTFKRLDDLKNEFVTQVAHDLKAPLGVIYGYASLLSSLPSLEEQENEIYVQPILGAITRMRALIDTVLDIGRIQMGIEAEFVPVNIAQVLPGVVHNLNKLADEKEITLAVEAPADLPAVIGAPMRLEQAVTNLVGNAIKFTPNGGSVTVRAGQENGQVVVSVTDTGPGIQPALQTKLFHRFARLGQSDTIQQEGHGLGLAIVKSIVDAHKGRVWVDSETGRGSTFAFALPATT
jgi:signal transduction histidine kinase